MKNKITIDFCAVPMKHGYLLLIWGFLLSISSLSAQVDHYETAVYADASWRYFVGTSQPPSNWRSFGFDDQSWPVGAGSIGYGDEDDNTIIAPTASLFMRQKFTVTDKNKIELATLFADFDDGFVAYLNGAEIARVNVEEDAPNFTTEASALREATLYSGGLPEEIALDGFVVQSVLVEGENVLAIQTHNFGGAASSDMTSLYWLLFGINDDSSDYGPVPDWFFPLEFESALPIVTIYTGGQYIPDEPEIAGQMGIIWNEDGTPNLSSATPNEFWGNITIERRGQTSQDLFPKTGFGIETKDAAGEDMDVSFLNFPEEEDWVLHGPYSDKSLLRNVVAMELARNMGQYASRTRLVELVINERYEGIYVLMERIKRDENRVDIANLREEDIVGDELTGGYVFKIDKGEADWLSAYNVINNPDVKLAFQYVSPKRTAIQPEQQAYIQSYVDSFERAMIFPYGTYGGKRYDEYIHLNSFADHFLLSELTKNVDAYRISSYLYKDKDSNGGLLKAGPAWDFNLAFGNCNYCNAATADGWMYQEHCDVGNPFWWQNMLDDSAFRNALKCRWEEFRAGPWALEEIYAFIDEQATLAGTAVTRNFQRWPILDQYIWPNVAIPGTYAGEVQYLKDFIAARIAWMDANISGECVVSDLAEITDQSGFDIYPNPAEGTATLTLNIPQTGKVSLRVFDALGRTRWASEQQFPAGQQNIPLAREEWSGAAGLYWVQLWLDGVSYGVKRVVFE